MCRRPALLRLPMLASMAALLPFAMGCASSPYDRAWVDKAVTDATGHGIGKAEVRAPSVAPGVVSLGAATADDAVATALWNSARFQIELTRLGFSRADLAEAPVRPLESETWAGCVDAVGGAMLARVLAQMRHGGSVAAVGLAGGAELPATVIPFLLRGVSLLGIDSVMAPIPLREAAWARVARDLDPGRLDAMTTAATLADLPALGEAILRGEVRGRVVVDLPA